MRCFIEHESERQRGEPLERGATCGDCGRQKTEEEPWRPSSPDAESAVTTALGPGTGTTAKPASPHAADQRRAGIADARRAGVGHQRNALARIEQSRDFGRPSPFVVLVEAEQLRPDAMVRNQDGGHPRVFGGDHVDLSEDVERAQRDVAQIPDRRGDHI